MNIMAIDLGKFNSVVCFYDKTTREHRFETVSTERGLLWDVVQNQQARLDRSGSLRPQRLGEWLVPRTWNRADRL